MGCAQSNPAAVWAAAEVYRKEVPRRVAFQSGDASQGWTYATVGKQLEGENTFEMRVDNNGPVLIAVLKRPQSLISFEDFAEYNEEQGGAEEDYDVFVKRLPLNIGQPIDIELEGGKTVCGQIATVSQYAPGSKLVVLHGGRAVDAEVIDVCNAGSLHKLRVQTGKSKAIIRVDLNEFNHAKQTFDDISEYNAVRATYLDDLINQLAQIEDAITGNRLNVDDQLIYITVVTKDGEKGPLSHISSMEALTDHLTSASPNRQNGTHGAQGILVRAGPGTGKTVSLQQLTRLMAKRLSSEVANEAGFGLVPMLISVQRLASHMKRGAFTDMSDLLRAYIEVEFSGQIRDMLLQAYEVRALVCAIDGVDEAAGLKTKIEDMLVEKLEPMGLRVVASSRPEGVRLERYQRFTTMDLAPLSDEQQQQAVAFQLKQSQEYDHFIALSKARKQFLASCPDALKASELSAHLKGAAGKHFEAIFAHVGASNAKDIDADEEFKRVMDFFDVASSVPVMLSMLVLCFEDLAAGLSKTRFPTSRLDLYTTAVRAAIRRRFAGDTEKSAAVELMLAKVATANHFVQRREFTIADVNITFAEAPDDLALWNTLEGEPAGVPLIKTLEIGAASAEAGKEELLTKYQFKHLSFQEAFFAEGLCALPEAAPAIVEQSQSVWKRGVLKVLNDRWMLNTFAICGSKLGKAVSDLMGKGLTELRLTEHQIKVMVALDWEPLRSQPSLKRLYLQVGFGIDFNNKDSPGVAVLADLLSDPAELTSLAYLEFGTPVHIGVGAATAIAQAVTKRKGLHLYGPVSLAQFYGLTDADAVLIATTLFNAGGSALDASVLSSARMGTSGGQVYIQIGPDSTLAQMFKAVNVTAASFHKDFGKHLMLSGFTASDMRSARYSIADLIEVGFSAVQLIEAMGNGQNTSAVLKELAENGLSLELAAGPARVELEDLRKAGCPGVPPDEAMEAAIAKCPAITKPEADLKELLGNLQTLTASREMLKDADGASILWAAALYCPPGLSDLNLARNEFGARTMAVLSQFLRFNTTVTSVDLHDNKVDDAAVSSLSRALSFNSSLKSIRLSSNEITSASSPMIFKGLSTNLALSSLVLETSAGAETPGIPVPQLKGLVANELIDLSSRRFGPVSVEVIAKLITEYRPQLIELGLDRNPILAAGVAPLAEILKVNDDIKDLDLRFCGIHTQGGVALANALRVNTSIERCYLLHNQLGDVGAKAFASMLPINASLRYLGLQDNQISDAMKATLKDVAAKRGNIKLVL